MPEPRREKIAAAAANRGQRIMRRSIPPAIFGGFVCILTFAGDICVARIKWAEQTAENYVSALLAKRAGTPDQAAAHAARLSGRGPEQPE